MTAGSGTFVGGWPSARLVLFRADAALRSMIDSMRVSDLVPLADDLPSARALLEQRFAQVQHHWDLPLHNTAPSPARLFVRVMGHKRSTTTLDLHTKVDRGHSGSKP